MKTLAERFWTKVERRGDDECWPWLRSVNPWGYGQISIGTGSDRRPHVAHRVAYELTFGPVPQGAVVDHTCHNDSECPGGKCSHRLCCNPRHLEAVTDSTNKARGKSPNAMNARKTHCKRGHEFTPGNTIIKRGKHRECRACHNTQQRERRKA